MAFYFLRRKDPLYGEPFDDIVSLGNSCRSSYQIALSNFRRTLGKFCQAEFDQAYWSRAGSVEAGLGEPPETVAANGDLVRRAAAFPSGRFFFDTLLAPFPAVIRCVNDDFKGVFDRRDLAISDHGFVTNRDGIVFFHDFSRLDGRTTPEILNFEYPSVSAKYTHLKAKMLTLFESHRRVLYVVRPPGADEIEEFVRTLRRHHRQHRFLVLSVAEAANPRGLIHADGEKVCIEINAKEDKPAASAWQGNDAEWGRVLDPVTLRQRSHPVWDGVRRWWGTRATLAKH